MHRLGLGSPTPRGPATNFKHASFTEQYARQSDAVPVTVIHSKKQWSARSSRACTGSPLIQCRQGSGRHAGACISPHDSWDLMGSMCDAEPTATSQKPNGMPESRGRHSDQGGVVSCMTGLASALVGLRCVGHCFEGPPMGQSSLQPSASCGVRGTTMGFQPRDRPPLDTPRSVMSCYAPEDGPGGGSSGGQGQLVLAGLQVQAAGGQVAGGGGQLQAAGSQLGRCSVQLGLQLALGPPHAHHLRLQGRNLHPPKRPPTVTLHICPCSSRCGLAALHSTWPVRHQPTCLRRSVLTGVPRKEAGFPASQGPSLA